MGDIDTIIANLTVSYKDLNVLSEDTPELADVNYFFNSICQGNKDLENFLYEIIGYSLTRTSKFSCGFIFKGDGRNGKSKIFRVLEKLLEEKQCSHEHLEDLSGNRLGAKSTVKHLKDKVVNIAEDQTQPKYINHSLITRLISGEPITIDINKNERCTFMPYATMLFSVNDVIDFKETNISITNRLWVVPFNATFIDEDNSRDINILYKITADTALQIIATRAVQAFEKVLLNKRFTIPDIVRDATEHYFFECNTVKEYCTLFPIKTIMFKSRYYNEYVKWCSANNKEAVSNSQFGKRVLALGYRAERYSFGNKRNTYYANPEFNNENSPDIYKRYRNYESITEEADIMWDNNPKRYSVCTFSDYLCKELYDKPTDV